MEDKELDKEINKLTTLTLLFIILAIFVVVFFAIKFDTLSHFNRGEIEIIFIPLGIIVLFLLFREIVTWYWKINRIVDLLEKIEKNTRKTKSENELS